MKEVTVNTTPNPEIEKLRTEKERNEAKLRYCKNQLKALSQEEQNLERKARNHRIFTRGAMLERLPSKPFATDGRAGLLYPEGRFSSPGSRRNGTAAHRGKCAKR
jgi:hypothetical protein